MISRCTKIALCALAAMQVVLTTAPAARAQALSVLPVNVHIPPGEQAATVNVTNTGTAPTSIQIRAYDWSQQGDKDELAASNNVVVSPPISTIAPGESQLVRLILRKPPQGREATYRIVLDQIPPAAEPGVVHVVLRMSIPIFAHPGGKGTAADVDFHVEVKDGETYLVGTNDGLSHEAIRKIELKTSDGRTLKSADSESPYVLAGTTRHWKIDAPDAAPQPDGSLQLTAVSDAGPIDRQVKVVSEK